MLIIGWLIGWLVTQFSQKRLWIFLIFCMKLGNYKGRKVTEPDFWKNVLIWRYSRKGLQISPKSDTDIFLRNGCNDFLGFWPEVSTKYDLHFEWNLFSEEFAIWRYLTSKSSKNCPNWGFWSFSWHFRDIISFPWFSTW